MCGGAPLAASLPSPPSLLGWAAAASRPLAARPHLKHIHTHTHAGVMQARVLAEARDEGTAGQPGALAVPVSARAAAALYEMAAGGGGGCEDDPRLRHLAFMALQVRVGRRRRREMTLGKLPNRSTA